MHLKTIGQTKAFQGDDSFKNVVAFRWLIN